MTYEIIHLKDRLPILGQDGCDPTAAVYLPDNLCEMQQENEKRPCLVICPGGSYEFCSQREGEPVALHFLPEGFNVFVLTYSVAPHRYPTQLREVAGLLELLHENADAWHCDVSHIAILGFSAGGHLAAHYATSYACPAVREIFPDSKPVQASVLCYPVITADPACAHLGSFDALTGKKNRTPAEIEQFSCDRQVRDGTPPAFLWHTAEDGLVPAMNSLLYAGALARHRIPFELHVYPYGGHGLSTGDRATVDQPGPVHDYAHSWLDCAKKWLRLMFDAKPRSDELP